MSRSDCRNPYVYSFDDSIDLDAKDTTMDEIMSKKRRKMIVINIPKAIFSILLLISLVMTLYSIVWQADKMTVVDPKFNQAVHGYIERAYWSSDPDTIKENLEKAVDGMHQLDLKDDDSANYFSWDKIKVDGLMSWEYQHMNSIIIRCDEMISWVNSTKNSTNQQWEDVYSQKLDNIRAFIVNGNTEEGEDSGGWSDDVAYSAYLVKYYPVYCFWSGIIFIIMLILWTIAIFGLFITW